MTMEICHLPNTITGQQVADTLNRDGVAIVDNLLSVVQVDELMAELRPWMEKTKPCADSFNGLNTRRTGAYAASW
jgi:hypothetical protein